MWPNPDPNADLFAFTEEILNGKHHFLCSVHSFSQEQFYNINEAEIPKTIRIT